SFPNQVIRKHFCLMDSGEGIVVRQKKAGRRGLYKLSPFLSRALEVIEQPRRLTDEAAKTYVLRVIRVANKIRGNARSGHGTTAIKAANSLVDGFRQLEEKYGRTEAANLAGRLIHVL